MKSAGTVSAGIVIVRVLPSAERMILERVLVSTVTKLSS